MMGWGWIGLGGEQTPSVHLIRNIPVDLGFVQCRKMRPPWGWWHRRKVVRQNSQGLPARCSGSSLHGPCLTGALSGLTFWYRTLVEEGSSTRPEPRYPRANRRQTPLPPHIFLPSGLFTSLCPELLLVGGRWSDLARAAGRSSCWLALRSSSKEGVRHLTYDVHMIIAGLPLCPPCPSHQSGADHGVSATPIIAFLAVLAVVFRGGDSTTFRGTVHLAT
ncbi:hypothetical protein LZ30DRAFT_688723 [Colletotrichum cereale]|nr:hypothetical protein LZ30DRAFT_688723 [Colletotrichum cereale]